MSLPVLNIPSQDLSKRPQPYLRAKHLHQWADALPITNISESIHLFMGQLRVLNHSRYPVKERMQLLEALRPISEELMTALKHQLQNAPAPLGEKDRRHAHSVHQILDNMAAGYKLVVSELVIRTDRKESEDIVLYEAIYLSIVYMARRLVESYLHYEPEPDGMWRELHQLYYYAYSDDIHHVPVDDTASTVLTGKYTIHNAYMRITMLALAEPYHLMQHESEEVYQLITPWVEDCHMLPADKRSIQDEYIVDLAGDNAPRYISAEQATVWQPVAGYMLDITAVKLKLDEYLHILLRNNAGELHLETSTLQERRQRDMLLRLADAWHGALTRKSQRRASGEHIRMATGLNACHYYISLKAIFTPEMDALKLQSAEDDNNTPSFDVTPTVFATTYREALQKDRCHTHSNYTINPWWQRNISDAGMALACTDDCQAMHVQVGEVVAYCFKGKDKGRWRVGVIRWLKSRGKEGMDMGIMDLGNTAVPIAVKAVKGLGVGTDYFRSLMIPKQVSLKQTRTLLVPASLYDVNTVLAINMKHKLFYIRLNRLHLSTLSFAQFEFEVLDEPPIVV